MQNYDVIVYIRGTDTRIVKTQASNPVIAFDLAVRQMYELPDDEKSRVVGITLKPVNKE